MSGIITDIKARTIIDSRGNPTVEVDCFVDGILMGRAASCQELHGRYEAVELRDNTTIDGKGVSKAVSNVNNEIRKLLLGLEVLIRKK